MSVAELARAAKELPPSELDVLTAQLVRIHNAAWDHQMKPDAASGKLDCLFEEADQERARGTLRRWSEDRHQ